MPACGAEVFDGKDLYSVMYEMFYSQASKIYTLTGCMPSCHQSEIRLEERYKSTVGNGSIRLTFVMMEEEYEGTTQFNSLNSNELTTTHCR